MQKTLIAALLSFITVMLIFCIPGTEIDKTVYSTIAPGMEKTIVDRAENSKDRQEHFFRMTRNPVTNQIPENIREKELAHADFLENGFKYKSSQMMEEIDIVEAGPNDVGGRTRGFGVDVRNSDVMLAGGASGGMWKSIDGGDNWTLKSELGQNLGVTSLVQDTLNPDTWYYSTGEFIGASSRARGGGGTYYGSGIYVTNDNGENWSQIIPTEDDDVSFNTQFDFISRIAINHNTGTKFFSSNAFGIFRSTDNFVTNNLVLGAVNEHVYSDVQVTKDGVIIAAISRAFNGVTQSNSSGVYISTNDGLNWTDITPNTYPDFPGRAVIGTSHSDPNIFFVFTADDSNQPTLHRFNIGNLDNISSSDRTNNIPDFGSPVGSLNLQGGYNMVCEIHPLNPDVIVIGGTNLFRSTDGFSTQPLDDNDDGITDDSEKEAYWIGGYANINNVSQYSSHHPDQHVAFFDPNDPDKLFSAHDGGISVTQNINAGNISWLDLNNGYNITQFYTVTIHPDAADERILGGTQDNGSPFFEYSDITGTSSSFDISSGDGAYAYLGFSYLTTSSQRGRLIKYDYNTFGQPTNFSYIAPLGASNQLFIHPYLVNHNNENIIFYPGGNKLFRNNSATSLNRNTSNSSGTNEGWSELTDFAVGSNRIISTLEISTTNPFDVLYYASSGTSVPQIYRLTNASTTTSASSLDIKSFTENNSTSVPPQGSYVHDIAVAEDNGNQILVVISNYETESLYYSSNGGDTWTGVGGNLEPQDGNGPSVRSAVIAKTASGEKTYFVGTSTGLYATNQLDGANTEWKLQGTNTLQHSIVEYLDYRPSDQTLAIGTHGRGIFIGNASMSVSTDPDELTDVPAEYGLNQNYPNPFNPSTTISYALPFNSTVNVTVYDINGRKVAELFNNKSQAAGTYDVSFDASNLASGIYLYRIDAQSTVNGNTFTDIKRMTLIK